MSVEHGEYDSPDEAGVESGSLIARNKQAWLISSVSVDADEVRISEIEQEPGRVRIHQSADGKIGYIDQVYDHFYLARLAYGLWQECGPFDEPEGRGVPLEVATHSRSAIAAYLRINGGYPRRRNDVARKMDITVQTVSNYCGDISWMPLDDDRPDA